MNCLYDNNFELMCKKTQFPVSSIDIHVSKFSLQLKENILNVGSNIWSEITKINEKVLIYSKFKLKLSF